MGDWKEQDLDFHTQLVKGLLTTSLFESIRKLTGNVSFNARGGRWRARGRPLFIGACLISLETLTLSKPPSQRRVTTNTASTEVPSLIVPLSFLCYEEAAAQMTST